MKSYRVIFTDGAKKELSQLDGQITRLILAWIRKNLEGCSDPWRHGKALTANRRGQWCYRIGNYRLIADIDDQTILIMILTVGHRSDIYK